jgi:hypothetical protein
MSKDLLPPICNRQQPWPAANDGQADRKEKEGRMEMCKMRMQTRTRMECVRRASIGGMGSHPRHAAGSTDSDAGSRRQQRRQTDRTQAGRAKADGMNVLI